MDQDSQSDKAGAYYEEHTEGLYLRLEPRSYPLGTV